MVRRLLAALWRSSPRAIGPAHAVALGAVLAPFVTWVPMLPFWGWQPSLVPIYPSTAIGMTAWQEHVLWAAFLAMLALAIGRVDPWLGLGVGYVAASVFVRGPFVDLTSALAVGLGAFAVTQLRRVGRGRRAIQRALVGAALLQGAYMLVQKAGYNPIWEWGVRAPAEPSLIGLLGNPVFASSWLAIVAPLASWWVGGLLLVPIVLSKSVTPLAAVMVGLAVRWRHRIPLWFTLGCGSLSVIALLHVKGWTGGTIRLAVWRILAEDWLSGGSPVWLTGWGLGAFQRRLIDPQVTDPWLRAVSVHEIFAQAHNDYLQWLYTTGLVGLFVAIGWLRSHWRAVLARPWGASLAVLAVLALTQFPLHHTALALLAVVIVGFALPPLRAADSPTSMMEA